MADEDDIVSQVTIEGVDQVDAEFNKMGESGAKNFAKVGEAAAAAAVPMGAVEAAARRAGVSVEEMNRRIAGNADSLKAGAAGASEFSQRLDQFEAGAQGAGKAALGMDINFTQLSGTLRALNRALHIPGLGALSGQLRVLGRIGAAAVPLLLIAGLEQLASSAAHAVSAMADLALKVGQTSAEFQTVGQFGAGAGVSIEKMGEAVTGVNALFKESAEKAEKNAEKILQLKETMRQLEQQATHLMRSLRDLELAGVKAFEKQTESATKFSRDSRSLDAELAKLEKDKNKVANTNFKTEEQRQEALQALEERELALSEKLLDQADQRRKELRDQRVEEEKRANALSDLLDQEEQNRKKQQETRKALSDAASEAARTGNAIERLGVSALDSNGKVRKFNEEGLKDLADAFQRVPDGAEKTKLASELVAAGLDRALLPALRRGREGVDEFIAEGKKIAPGFTDAQEAIGDKFVESANKFTLALKNLKDQAGIEIAPGFTKFFDDMRTRVTNAIPFVQELSKAFGFLIGLTGKLSLQPSPIIAAIQLIKAAVGELNLGWATIPKIAKFWFDLLKSIVSGVWEFIKDAFASGLAFIKSIKVGDVLAFVWDLVKQGVSALWDFIKQKFNDGITFLKSISVGDVLSSLWDLIKQGANALWDFLVQKFKEGVTALQNLLPEDPLAAAWELIKQGASAAWDFIVQKFQEGAAAAWKFFTDKADEAITWFGQKIDEGIGKLKDLWTWVKQVASSFASLFGASDKAAASAATPALARGGQVRGKGTSTSDSILAFLSNDEFVVRAAAVKKYGAGLLHAINTMQLPKNGFSLGGLASGADVRSTSRAIIPRFATGGIVTAPRGGRPLVLKIGDENFNLRTRDDETAEQITRYAIRRQVRSSGRKPSAWG
jgi:hypothetical protein